MIKAFLFDLDGVLTDTSEYHYLAWKRLADEEGIPFNRQDNDALRGVSRHESLNRLLKDRLISEEAALAWMERKNGYYVEMISKIEPGELLPGVETFLRELRQAGITIIIASASKNARLVVSRLRLWDLVDGVADGLDVVISKPAPDLFLEAARRSGAAPEECIVVEDAQAGVQAAHAAGMRTIGLGPVERVGAAELVLPDLSQARLSDILTKLDKS